MNKSIENQIIIILSKETNTKKFGELIDILYKESKRYNFKELFDFMTPVYDVLFLKNHKYLNDAGERNLFELLRFFYCH